MKSYSLRSKISKEIMATQSRLGKDLNLDAKVNSGVNLVIILSLLHSMSYVYFFL